MNKYPYKEAKSIVQAVSSAATDGMYDTREKFLTMLAANPDIAAQGYNAFGKIFFWNDASVLLYGYKEEDAVNRDIFETILPPEMRRMARTMVQSAAETGRTPEPSACDLLHRSGEYVTVFSGHLLFRWDGPTTPEFYCVDVGVESPLR
jgi:PAS domain S-box-containing protein